MSSIDELVEHFLGEPTPPLQHPVALHLNCSKTGASFGLLPQSEFGCEGIARSLAMPVCVGSQVGPLLSSSPFL